MTMTLAGKKIIITGASQGLGATLAIKASQLGATVILVARTKKLLDQISQKITDDGGRAVGYECDIRDLEMVKKVVQKILIDQKEIDILVNNAGIWTDDDLESKQPELRNNAFATNALGNIQFTKELLPHFQQKNQGYIFNVISAAGLSNSSASDNALWQTYGATKWAMTGFTQALRQSLANTKLKVTGFFPGGFDSNLYQNAHRPNPHFQPWMMKLEDVAEVILFALTRPDDVLLEQIVMTKAM